MKKQLLLIASIIILLTAGLGLFFFIEAEDDEMLPDNRTAQQPASQEDSVPAATMATMAEGIAAKQRAFEALNPAYPDQSASPIVYELADSMPLTTPDVADQFLLNIVQDLAPTDAIRSMVTAFEVYFNEDDDTLAAVESRTINNDEWLFSLNYIAVTDFEELIDTIVHEYAHIVSLQEAQTITEDEDPTYQQSCQAFLVAEGCLENTSYLETFFDQFWRGTEDFTGDGERTADETFALFEKYPTRYVSDYAATNGLEDFAESFMFYVLRNLPADGVRREKVAFFDTYEEFRNYKQTVLTTTRSWAAQ